MRGCGLARSRNQVGVNPIRVFITRIVACSISATTTWRSSTPMACRSPTRPRQPLPQRLRRELHEDVETRGGVFRQVREYLGVLKTCQPLSRKCAMKNARTRALTTSPRVNLRRESKPIPHSLAGSCSNRDRLTLYSLPPALQISLRMWGQITLKRLSKNRGPFL